MLNNSATYETKNIKTFTIIVEDYNSGNDVEENQIKYFETRLEMVSFSNLSPHTSLLQSK